MLVLVDESLPKRIRRQMPGFEVLNWMGVLAPSKTLLSRLPGTTVVDSNAGCCGMAGSFGYAREHFEVSRAIAERHLLPAIRQKAPGTVVVAAGTSCRHQVLDLL